MSFFQFCVANKAAIWGVVSSSLYIVAEYLANNPKIDANSPFQLVKGWLKQESNQAQKP